MRVPSLVVLLLLSLPLAAGADSLLIERVTVAQDADWPTRGMAMEQVAGRWGEPVTRNAPVGRPPITRWEYPGFTVVFEDRQVLHSVARHQP